MQEPVPFVREFVLELNSRSKPCSSASRSVPSSMVCFSDSIAFFQFGAASLAV
jgi:hypothetical protein